MVEFAKNLTNFISISGKKHVIVLSSLSSGRKKQIDPPGYHSTLGVRLHTSIWFWLHACDRLLFNKLLLFQWSADLLYIEFQCWWNWCWLSKAGLEKTRGVWSMSKTVGASKASSWRKFSEWRNAQLWRWVVRWQLLPWSAFCCNIFLLQGNASVVLVTIIFHLRLAWIDQCFCRPKVWRSHVYYAIVLKETTYLTLSSLLMLPANFWV